ncbi:MAG: DUF1127 domain-containing protein [Proteobacteria bacterium]|nr:DUF1127 domain-containing protein [Pseudomonadota bacterium]
MTTMTHHRTTTCHGSQSPEPEGLLIRFIDWIADAMDRSRQRRALATLSDHQLHDIGLSRSDVANEAAKPFWRV